MVVWFRVVGMVSLSAAAAQFGYSTDTIRRWVKRGLVEAVKGPTVNSPWKVDTESLARLLADGAEAGRTGRGAVRTVEPMPIAVASWLATAEEWNDSGASDDLDGEQRRDVLLAIEGVTGRGGLMGELKRVAERIR